MALACEGPGGRPADRADNQFAHICGLTAEGGSSSFPRVDTTLAVL